MMGNNTTYTFEKNICIQYGGSKMVAKNVYPVKMKSLLLYNDMTQSGVGIARNVEKRRGGGTHLKITLYVLSGSPPIQKRKTLFSAINSHCHLHWQGKHKLDY
jgi:hypothetical protein